MITQDGKKTTLLEMMSGLNDFEMKRLADMTAIVTGSKLLTGEQMAELVKASLDAEKIREHEEASREQKATALGFDSITEVSAGATLHIEQVPQVPFKGLSLYIEPGCARSFDLVDVKVGVSSQLVTSAAVPAFAFGRAGPDGPEGLPLELAACQVAQKLTLVVRNTSGAPARFRAVLWGHMLTW